MASVLRPSDGYEVTIETPEQVPLAAARYALGILADAWKSLDAHDPALLRAGKELGQDAAEALVEVSELSGAEIGDKRMTQSLRDKIEIAARRFVLETFTEPSEQDYQVILNAMLKAANISLDFECQ